MILLEGRITWKMIHNLFDVYRNLLLFLVGWVKYYFGPNFWHPKFIIRSKWRNTRRKIRWKGRSVIENRVCELVSYMNDRKIHFSRDIFIYVWDYCEILRVFVQLAAFLIAEFSSLFFILEEIRHAPLRFRRNMKKKGICGALIVIKFFFFSKEVENLVIALIFFVGGWGKLA